MKTSITHPIYGQITYEENFWHGRKTIVINGIPLQKVKKNEYVLNNGETSVPVTLVGSFFAGATLMIQGEEIRLIAKPTVLDWILALLPAVLVVVWGNSIKLCSIIPIIGGAIGGAIGGFGTAFAMLKMRNKNIGLKLLISLATTVITFAVCAALGIALVTAIYTY